MNEDFLVSKRTGTSSSWTLTTRLGQMLQEAEKRYGRRDREFTLLGIESPRVLIQYTGPSRPAASTAGGHQRPHRPPTQPINSPVHPKSTHGQTMGFGSWLGQYNAQAA